MTKDERDRQIKEISQGLDALLAGKNKELTITAALSVAATSAFMVGVSKLELQQKLVRFYDARVREHAQAVAAAEPGAKGSVQCVADLGDAQRLPYPD